MTSTSPGQHSVFKTSKHCFHADRGSFSWTKPDVCQVDGRRPAIRSPEANGGGVSASRFAGAVCFTKRTGAGSVLSPRPLRVAVGPKRQARSGNHPFGNFVGADRFGRRPASANAPRDRAANCRPWLRNAEPRARCTFLTCRSLTVRQLRVILFNSRMPPFLPPRVGIEALKTFYAAQRSSRQIGAAKRIRIGAGGATESMRVVAFNSHSGLVDAFTISSRAALHSARDGPTCLVFKHRVARCVCGRRVGKTWFPGNHRGQNCRSDGVAGDGGMGDTLSVGISHPALGQMENRAGGGKGRSGRKLSIRFAGPRLLHALDRKPRPRPRFSRPSHRGRSTAGREDRAETTIHGDDSDCERSRPASRRSACPRFQTARRQWAMPIRAACDQFARHQNLAQRRNRTPATAGTSGGRTCCNQSRSTIRLLLLQRCAELTVASAAAAHVTLRPGVVVTLRVPIDRPDSRIAGAVVDLRHDAV